jgi:O-antigen ligase/uncharacterized membrane protein YbhN (UPF0104 family)
MPGRRIARLAVSAVLLLVVIASVLWISDPKAVTAAGSELFSLSIVLVLLLLLGGVVLSSLRLQLITSDLGYRLTFRDAAMTLSVGQLAGTAFFQLAGQLIGRSAILSRRGIPPAATVVISGYERVVALSVSLLLAGAGALYLFGSLSLNLQTGGLSLIKLALGLLAATVASALLAWGQTILDFMRKATLELFFRLLRCFVISLAIQATTLAAYVALERALAPNIGIASLAAASCIVMLAASLPVSFGGWGLRELSAVVALQAIGLSSASALVIALLIGFLSFAVIAGMAIVVMLGWEPTAGPRAATSDRAAPDYSAALDWALPLMAATALFFQIYLPTGDGRISVNLADPVVMLGASVFALHHLGKGWPVWRIAHANAWVAGGSAVVLLSVLHGWASFGWTDWAFVNRGLGWLMLLCYGATGALIVRRAQLRGLDALLRTLAASGAAIALIEIGLVVLKRVGLHAADGLVEARISGMSQNPNAFAFVLLMVLAAAIVLRLRPVARTGLMAIALLGLWLTGSRAGLIALPVVFGAALLAGVALRPLLTAVLVAAASIAVIAVLPLLTRSGGGALQDVMIAFSQDVTISTYQHLQTVQDGLAMFLAHPILGAGLGAYMDGQLRTAGEPLVIHSTPVWLLAETGMVGCAVFLAAAWCLFGEAVRHRGEPAGQLLLLILCALAVMSSAHELLYQRAFWLLLGAVLAVSGTAAHNASRVAAKDASDAKAAGSPASV